MYRFLASESPLNRRHSCPALQVRDSWAARGGPWGHSRDPGPPGPGALGGYDLASPADRAFAFDYDHSGKLDHLVLYRPGEGTIWILNRL